MRSRSSTISLDADERPAREAAVGALRIRGGLTQQSANAVIWVAQDREGSDTARVAALECLGAARHPDAVGISRQIAGDAEERLGLRTEALGHLGLLDPSAAAGAFAAFAETTASWSPLLDGLDAVVTARCDASCARALAQAVAAWLATRPGQSAPLLRGLAAASDPQMRSIASLIQGTRATPDSFATTTRSQP